MDYLLPREYYLYAAARWSIVKQGVFVGVLYPKYQRQINLTSGVSVSEVELFMCLSPLSPFVQHHAMGSLCSTTYRPGPETS